MNKKTKNQNDSPRSRKECEKQKKLYKKIFGFVSSRFLFFTIGLFISVAVLTAYAAWDTTVTTGETLTATKWNDLVNKISSMETVIAVHSQTSTVPNCPAGWTGLWDGYSLALVGLAQGYVHSQDLGNPGSCLKEFRKMPIIECNNPAGNCEFYTAWDFSAWLSADSSAWNLMDPVGNNKVGRCRVCSKPAPVIVVHSQTTSVPDCPAGWTSLWEGYSLALASLGENYTQSQDLGSPGSCLPQFRKMPIFECNDPGANCYLFGANDYSGWLTVYTADRAPEMNPDISRCRVCSK